MLGAALVLDVRSTTRQRDRDLFALCHRLRLAGQPSDAGAAKFHIPGVAGRRSPREVDSLGLCLATLLCRDRDIE